jgi:hypothetical protein
MMSRMESEFISRARAFLDQERRALTGPEDIGPGGAARLLLLIEWTGDLDAYTEERIKDLKAEREAG